MKAVTDGGFSLCRTQPNGGGVALTGDRYSQGLSGAVVPTLDVKLALP